MFGDHDDGFGLFSDDPQEQFFGYYCYTQMTGDDPMGLFDDELPQDVGHGCGESRHADRPPYTDAPQGAFHSKPRSDAFHSSTFRPTGKVQPHTQRYADYLKNRPKKSNFSFSSFFFYFGMAFYIVLVLVALSYYFS